MTAHIVGCTGKVRLTGFRQARQAAKRLRQKDNGAHVEAYACKACHGFHVGESRNYGKKSAKKDEQS
jgi:acetyl esterase/lipase